MSLFESIHNCATSVIFRPFVVAQQCIAMLKQYSAKSKVKTETQQEAQSVVRLSLQCSHLTMRQVQAYVNSSKFTEMLDIVAARAGAIVLQEHSDILKPFEHKVNEYLAVTTLVETSDDQAAMSNVLRYTLMAIADSLYTMDDRLLQIRDAKEYNCACTLIEHIILHRQQMVRSAVGYTLRQYVNINEMLQLLHILQEKINNTNDNGKYNGNINISSVLRSYLCFADSLSLVTGKRHRYISKIQTILCTLINTEIDYDIAIVTQVFAALAARRELYYEMQRSFNSANDAYINVIVQYARNDNLPHSVQQQSQTKSVEQLVQLRIAHALRTYCAYHILEEFVYSVFTSRKLHLSDAERLQLCCRARVAISLVEAIVLDLVVIEMAVKFTEYIHASVLIHVINECDDRSNAAHMHKLLAVMDNNKKEEIVDSATAYLFNVAAMQSMLCGPHQQTLTAKDTVAIVEIMHNINPLNTTHDAQFVQYIRTQAMQILNSLPTTRFHKLIVNIQPILRSICDTQEKFNMLYRNIHVVRIMALISQDLDAAQGGDPYSVMGQAVYSLSAKSRHIKDVAIMRAVVQNTRNYNTQLMYLLTNILSHQIYDNCVSYTKHYVKQIVRVCILCMQYL